MQPKKTDKGVGVLLTAAEIRSFQTACFHANTIANGCTDVDLCSAAREAARTITDMEVHLQRVKDWKNTTTKPKFLEGQKELFGAEQPIAESDGEKETGDTLPITEKARGRASK